MFERRRIAVFIDGCFWHRCPIHRTDPKANAEYWGPKLERNSQRDREATQALTSAGWIVMRFWEHERPEDVAKSIIAVWKRAGGSHESADAE